jgi:hypothetical protein
MSLHPTFEIKPLYDESDEVCEYMVRGHVNRTDLLRQLNAEFPRFGRFEECDLVYEWRHTRPDPTGNMVCFYDPSSRGVRGAFACTIVEINGPLERSWAAPSAPADAHEEGA